MGRPPHYLDNFAVQVVISRISMAAPGMFALPVIMEKMEKQSWFKTRPVLHAPFQVMGVGCFLLFMVPTACSIWPQTMSVTSEHLRWDQTTTDLQSTQFYISRTSDPEAFSQLKLKYGEKIPEVLFYNKGL